MPALAIYFGLCGNIFPGLIGVLTSNACWRELATKAKDVYYIMNSLPEDKTWDLAEHRNSKSSTPIMLRDNPHQSSRLQQTTTAGFFAVVLIVLVLIVIIIWIMMRRNPRRSRRSVTATNMPKSDRECVARFYTPLVRSSHTQYEAVTNTDSNDANSILPSRIKSLLGMPRLLSAKTKNFEQTRNEITGPSTAQKLNEENNVCTTSTGRLNFMQVEEIPRERNLSQCSLPPYLGVRSSQSELSDSQTSCRRSSALFSRRDSPWFLEKLGEHRAKRYSITGNLFNYFLFDQTRQNCVSEAEDKWINWGSSRHGQGRISFALSYVCTTGILEVTINSLSGVHQLTTSENLLPSQTQTTFSVTLRLKDTASESTHSFGCNTTYTTHTVSASFNPIFDQTFKFQLNPDDIAAAELIFTVFRTICHPVSAEDLLTHRLSVPELQRPATKRRPSIEYRPHGTTCCLGVASYKLIKEELLNSVDKNQVIWLDIRRSNQSDENCSKESEVHEEACYMEKPTPSSFYNDHSSQLSSAESKFASVHVALFFDRTTSHLFVHLLDIKNLHFRKKDVSVYIRSVLYKGDKILASMRSPATEIQSSIGHRGKTSKESLAGIPEIIPCSRGEIARFPIDTNRLLNEPTLGLILFLCTKGRFEKNHLIGQCAIGGSAFTNGSGVDQWNCLVHKLLSIMNSPVNITERVESWQPLI